MGSLPEEVTMLAYRDGTGRNSVPYLQTSLAGAALMELALSEHIDVDKSGLVTVPTPKPAGQPVLDDVLTRVSGSKARHTVSSWVQILSGVNLAKPILDCLVAQGVLALSRGRILGLIPIDRYSPSDTRVETDIGARLEHAFGNRADADVRTAALAAIVSATFMETVALPQHEYSAVRRVFTDLGQSRPVIKNVADGLQLAVASLRSGAGGVVA